MQIYDVEEERERELGLAVPLGIFLRLDYTTNPVTLLPENLERCEAWLWQVRESKEAVEAELAILNHQIATQQLRDGVQHYAQMLEDGEIPTFTDEQLREVGALICLSGGEKILRDSLAQLGREEEEEVIAEPDDFDTVIEETRTTRQRLRDSGVKLGVIRKPGETRRSSRSKSASAVVARRKHQLIGGDKKR